MKKLFMIVLAVVLSLGVASLGYAQAPAGDKKMEEKKHDMKADGKMDKKADGKMMEKKADGKMDKKADKKAANPCAAKAAEKK